MKRILFFLCFSLIVMISGCSLHTNEPTVTATLLPSLTPSRTPSPTLTQTPTITPTPTQTPTPTALGGGTGQLAFTSIDIKVNGFSAYIINADGTDLRRISNADISSNSFVLVWSPGGKEVLVGFQPIKGRNLYSNGDIYSYAIDSSEFTKFITNAFISTGSWSKDGSKIVYTCDATGRGEICIVNWDGTDKHQLTRKGARDPFWSPDGTRIYFRKSSRIEDGVWYTNVSGDPEARLETLPESGYNIAFSPDGSKMAYFDGDTIMLANVDGTNAVSLIMLPGNDLFWSPDSTKLFVNDFYVNYIVNVRDGSFAKLPDNLSFSGQRSPWSPDSQYVAGSNISPGTEHQLGEIVIVNITTMETKIITNLGSRYANYDPIWQPAEK